MVTKKSGGNKDSNLGVAVGLGAAAAAVGAYFMYGSKKAAKNRKAVKSWMFKAKAEVLEALENTEEMSKREYERLIDEVGKSYGSLKDATRNDMAGFKKEMKEHWLEIAKTATPKKTPAKKIAKKIAKKTTKAPAKKPSAKKAPAKKTVKKDS